MTEILIAIGGFLKTTAPLWIAIITLLAFKRYAKRRGFEIDERKISIKAAQDLMAELRKERNEYREEATALREEVKELSVTNARLEAEVANLTEEIQELKAIILELRKAQEQE